jgi:uncharacterized linocin/CFP29 family protein
MSTLINNTSGCVLSAETSLTGIGTSYSTGTTLVYNNLNNQQVMQSKVAVFKITRNEDEKIIKTEFIKELWVETKNGQSVDFQVARDKDLAKYEMSDLSIKTIHTVSFHTVSF